MIQPACRLANVSILAHPERWALRRAAGERERDMPFQSSPTPKGGRYFFSISNTPRQESFNPRPPRKVGATLERVDRRQLHAVSILAHPERWALRNGHTGSNCTLLSFNPRPPRKVGATVTSSGFFCSVICFNPRPPRKVGATGSLVTFVSGILGFNPRPPRKVGATGNLSVYRAMSTEFQSSPTPKGGRYGSPWTMGMSDALVSILAHPERWALQRSGRVERRVLRFQSSPTPKGGRYAWPGPGMWP